MTQNQSYKGELRRDYMSSREVVVETVAEEAVNLPQYASEGCAGADVRAHLTEPVIVQPGTIAVIPTGLYFAIPEGYEIQVRPRSGLALRNQISVLNAPGTIDSDYRGELKILLINHGKEPFTVEPGMRVAQLVLAPVVKAIFIRMAELSQTSRGSGGFGHTGVQ
jgi:dUTP pyrophosphatase